MAVDSPTFAFKTTLGALARYRAEESGERDFLVSMESRWSYEEIEASSAAVARRMLHAGIGKGTRLGLYFSYSREWVVFWLAASRIGALVVPFSTIYAPVEFARVLKISDVAVLICPSTLMGKDVASFLEGALPSLASETQADLFLAEAPYLRSISMSDHASRPWATTFEADAPVQAGQPNDAFLHRVESEVVPSDAAIVVFTSGSSAAPKGVVHTHQSVILQSSMLPGLMEKRSNGLPAKIVCGMPFFWVGGILTLVGSLQGAMPLMIMERFDPLTAMKLIEREKATVLMGWPTLTQKILSHPEFEKHDLSSAPTIVSGVDTALIGVPVPGVPAHRGMSETLGSFACIATRVVNPETGVEVEDGQEGELLVRGPGLMEGYYKRSRADVFDEEGWFRTGDKVFRVPNDPRCYYQGRFTDMIKTAGANVAPREVEMAVETFDDVLHCFVFGIPDAEQGEAIAAIVALRAGSKADANILHRHARSQLSSYKVPKQWVFIEPETIPWLGSGKADKIRLKALLSTRVGADPAVTAGSAVC